MAGWYLPRGSDQPMYFDPEPTLELEKVSAPKGHGSDAKAQKALDASTES